jgi:hypothetical protein
LNNKNFCNYIDNPYNYIVVAAPDPMRRKCGSRVARIIVVVVIIT